MDVCLFMFFFLFVFSFLYKCLHGKYSWRQWCISIYCFSSCLFGVSLCCLNRTLTIIPLMNTDVNRLFCVKVCKLIWAPASAFERAFFIMCPFPHVEREARDPCECRSVCPSIWQSRPTSMSWDLEWHCRRKCVIFTNTCTCSQIM